MRGKFVITLLLFLLLLAQVGAMVVILAPDEKPPALPAKEGLDKEKPVPAAGKRIALQPAPPARLPDLHEGYIFNAARSFKAGGAETPGQKVENIDLAKIQYTGSIITAKSTKGLLSHPTGAAPAQVQIRGRAPLPMAPRQGFLQVVVGDSVGGYKVTEILPEKIVFSRGGEKIEKLLYERNKVRAIPAAPAAPPAVIEQQSPAPASVAVPNPGGGEPPPVVSGNGERPAASGEPPANPFANPPTGEQRPPAAAQPASQPVAPLQPPAITPPVPPPTTRQWVIPGKPQPAGK